MTVTTASPVAPQAAAGLKTPSKMGKMVEVATRIPRVVLAILVDIGLLPAALLLLVSAALGHNPNPKDKDVKMGKVPILLLHGSGFNQSEWLVGRRFLNRKEYGSVFSINYDGLASNDPGKGIEDYALGPVSAEVRRIKKLTGCDKVIVIGHSLGGLVAGYYAEHGAERDGVTVEHVITIASPWQGTPAVDMFWKLGGWFSQDHETKRHQQMSVVGGTKADPQFRQRLVAKARESEVRGVRRYYNIWSTTDYAVPSACGCLTLDIRRQRSFSYLGHYGIIAAPCVWRQARSWLDIIYDCKK